MVTLASPLLDSVSSSKIPL